jgi:hypothetical protein
MQDISPLSRLATKALTKHIDNIGLVVDDQYAETHEVIPAVPA